MKDYFKRLIRFDYELDYHSVGIYIGRFQPPHNGHKKIIELMSKNHELSYIFVVDGDKSSSNLDRNPYSIKKRKELLSIIVPENVKILVVKNAYLPDIFKQYSEIKSSDFILYCGEDRVDEYNRFCYILKESNIFCETRKTERYFSSTEIRKMIKNKEEIQKFLPYNVNML